MRTEVPDNQKPDVPEELSEVCPSPVLHNNMFSSGMIARLYYVKLQQALFLH